MIDRFGIVGFVGMLLLLSAGFGLGKRAKVWVGWNEESSKVELCCGPFRCESAYRLSGIQACSIRSVLRFSNRTGGCSGFTRLRFELVLTESSY